MTEPLRIIYHRGHHDEMILSLNLAAVAAAGDRSVRILFSGWALERLAQGRLGEVVLGPAVADRLAWYREKVGVGPVDEEMTETLASIKALGDVKIYACSRACDMFDVGLDQLAPLVDEIVGSAHFLFEETASGPILFL